MNRYHLRCQQSQGVDSFIFFLDAFFFQAAEKGLGNSVVPAVASTTHAAFELARSAEPSPIVAAVQSVHEILGSQGNGTSRPSKSAINWFRFSR